MAVFDFPIHRDSKYLYLFHIYYIRTKPISYSKTYHKTSLTIIKIIQHTTLSYCYQHYVFIQSKPFHHSVMIMIEQLTYKMIWLCQQKGVQASQNWSFLSTINTKDENKYGLEQVFTWKWWKLSCFDPIEERKILESTVISFFFSSSLSMSIMIPVYTSSQNTLWKIFLDFTRIVAKEFNFFNSCRRSSIQSMILQLMNHILPLCKTKGDSFIITKVDKKKPTVCFLCGSTIRFFGLEKGREINWYFYVKKYNVYHCTISVLSLLSKYTK